MSPLIQDRTFLFSVRVVKLYKHLIKQPHFPYPIANQLLKAATSIGANVAEAQAAQSKKDFIAKMCIASKEARETHYWIKLLIASELIPKIQLKELQEETHQLIAILTSIIKTSQQRHA